MRHVMRPAAFLAGGLLLFLSACELPPVDAVDLGFRGVGMQQVDNPRTLQDSMDAVAARVPQLAPTPDDFGEPAPPGTWENVQVLGHLSEAEFNRFMLAMTTWVAQETGQGCNYCHVIEDDGSVNFASDDIYTKVVSRRMIEMNQSLNVNFAADHIREGGINCWTCHQGQVLPNNYWFYSDGTRRDFDRYFVNEGTRQIERYYLDQRAVRVISPEALSGNTDNTSSIQDTEHLYWIMIQMSEGLGVNCTFCHTSARFSDWEQSPPSRVHALRGVNMVRYLNDEYMVPLQDAWPEERLGPMGDGPKIQCATCHNGAWIPQYGNPATRGETWPALTQIGTVHPSAPSETPAEGTPDQP